MPAARAWASGSTDKRLGGMTDNGLLNLYEAEAGRAHLGPEHIVAELERRQVHNYTRAMHWMTVTITVATVVNVAVTIRILLR